MPARTASETGLLMSRRYRAACERSDVDALKVTRSARYHRRAWRTGSVACGGSSTRRTRPGCCAGCPTSLPKHVGVMLDGNRRWAKAVGPDTAHGHQAGADNIEPLLGWCEEVGIEVVTLWLLSTDNLNRPPDRARARCSRSSRGPSSRSPTERRWRAAPGGRPRPAAGGDRREAQGRRGGHPRRRRDAGQHRGRVRRPPRDRRRRPLAAAASTPAEGTSLEELAEIIDVEHIAEHLYTKGQPDPDLVIRTSGEQRLGGFLLWQSAQVGVLLLRGLLARLPPRRLPARDPRLRPARAPLRRLSALSSGLDVTGSSPRGRACRTRSPAPAAYVRGSGEWGSSPYREARIVREHDTRLTGGSSA